jgi:hypothetical protein
VPTDPNSLLPFENKVALECVPQQPNHDQAPEKTQPIVHLLSREEKNNHARRTFPQTGPKEDVSDRCTPTPPPSLRKELPNKATSKEKSENKKNNKKFRFVPFRIEGKSHHSARRRPGSKLQPAILAHQENIHWTFRDFEIQTQMMTQELNH